MKNLLSVCVALLVLGCVNLLPAEAVPYKWGIGLSDSKTKIPASDDGADAVISCTVG